MDVHDSRSHPPRRTASPATDPSAPKSPAPEATGTEAEHLVYLYAVIEAESPARALLREGRISGLVPDAPLFPIEQEGLIAAASSIPALAFSDEAIDAFTSNLQALAPFALAHEEAIRALLPATSALVPLTFGAVYRTPERVAAFLHERQAELRAALDRVRDRDEWGIKVFRDTPRFTQVVLATSESMRQAEAELRAASPGRAYLLRKSRERRIEDEVEAETDRAAARVAQQLAGAAALARREAIPLEAGPRGRPAPRALVLKAAFLVDRASSEAFAARCDAIARLEAARGLEVELTGPWAPYSFVAEAR